MSEVVWAWSRFTFATLHVRREQRGHRCSCCADHTHRRCCTRGRESISAPVVISNADPRQTQKLLGTAADSAWSERVERIPIEGCTVKLNVLLRELPDFTARPGKNHLIIAVKSTATYQSWNGRPALPLHDEASCRITCGASCTSRASMMQPWLRRGSIP